MKRKYRPPFPEPSTQEWLVSLRRTYRQSADFYKLVILASLLLPALYLAFTWFVNRHEPATLSPGAYFLVSWADVHADLDELARTIDPDAKLVAARFMVWPYIDEELDIQAIIVYSVQNISSPIRFSVIFNDGRYQISSFLSENEHFLPFTLEPGYASSLPEDLLFQDSLLAFEALYPQQEDAITENYSDIAWPMMLSYSLAPSPNWELCYSLEQAKELFECVHTTGVDQHQD